jgi:hypothetical protein
VESDASLNFLAVEHLSRPDIMGSDNVRGHDPGCKLSLRIRAELARRPPIDEHLHGRIRLEHESLQVKGLACRSGAQDYFRTENPDGSSLCIF